MAPQPKQGGRLRRWSAFRSQAPPPGSIPAKGTRTERKKPGNPLHRWAAILALLSSKAARFA